MLLPRSPTRRMLPIRTRRAGNSSPAMRFEACAGFPLHRSTKSTRWPAARPHTRIRLGLRISGRCPAERRSLRPLCAGNATPKGLYRGSWKSARRSGLRVLSTDLSAGVACRGVRRAHRRWRNLKGQRVERNAQPVHSDWRLVDHPRGTYHSASIMMLSSNQSAAPECRASASRRRLRSFHR